MGKKKRAPRKPGLMDKIADLVKEDPKKAVEFAALAGVAVGQFRASSMGYPEHYAKFASDQIVELAKGIADAMRSGMPAIRRYGALDFNKNGKADELLLLLPAVGPLYYGGYTAFDRLLMSEDAKLKKKVETPPPATVLIVSSPDLQYIKDAQKNYEDRGYTTKITQGYVETDWKDGGTYDATDPDAVRSAESIYRKQGYQTKRETLYESDLIRIWIRLPPYTGYTLYSSEAPRYSDLTDEEAKKYWYGNNQDYLLSIGDAALTTLFLMQMPKFMALGTSVLSKLWEEGLPGEFT